jgi:hypothetical protein
MFGSEVLEVAIGLVFVYLLLSVLCSAIAELIETLESWAPSPSSIRIR